MQPDRSSCLNLSANGSMGRQISWDSYFALWKTSSLSLIKCIESSIWSFLKCMDGSVWSFLKCTDGSVWTHLNGSYRSVWSHLRFLIQSAPTRFPQLGNSVDHCFYEIKATKQHIGNRMLDPRAPAVWISSVCEHFLLLALRLLGVWNKVLWSLNNK